MAVDGRHSTQLRNHILENFTFADAAARAAGTGYTIVVADIGKVAFQTDTSAYYRLTDESPITWVLIAGSGSFAPATAKYIVAEASADLSAEVSLGLLTTGLLKHTVSGAVSTPATAVAGTDYYNPGGTDVAVADGGTGSSTAAGARTNLGLGASALLGDDYRAVTFSFDGGGAAVAVSSKAEAIVPYTGTIVEATIIADVSGSAVVDILKSTYSGYDTMASIAASAKPTLSSVIKNTDSTLTGWTTSVTAGDIMRANVDSASTVTRLTVSIKIRRTA